MDQKNIVDLLTGVFIVSFPERYRVCGVQYLGESCTVDISKVLLEDGAKHTQDDWIDKTRQGEWKLPSGPLYFAVLGALYDNRSAGQVENVRKMLEKDFKDQCMMTSTRIRYACEGVDTVVHDWRYASQRAEEANIVSKKGYIGKVSGSDEKMGALVGISDSCRIVSVGVYVVGKNPYFSGLESKPEEVVDSPLVLTYGVGLDFEASRQGYYSDSRRARGMVVRRAEKSS